jgi:hypothetical protein
LGCCFTYRRMKVHKQTMVSRGRRWQRQCDISKNSVGIDTANFLYINPYRRLVWEKKSELKTWMQSKWCHSHQQQTMKF